MNKEKRKNIKKLGAGITLIGAMGLLPNEWIRPIVISSILPAHAQTSHCGIKGIAGEWEFIIDGDIFLSITLTENGKGTGSANALVEWKLDGQNVGMFIRFSNQAAGGFFIQASVVAHCLKMQGGNSIINPGQPISPVIPNTFIANKKI